MESDRGGSAAEGATVAPPSSATPAEVIAFWFDEHGPDDWFADDAGFDTAVRDRFAELVDAALAGGLGDWTATPDGALALCLVLDQFPRNLFRGSARAYAGDSRARAVADLAIDQGFDLGLPEAHRLFLYMPFQHAESLGDQRRALRLISDLGGQPDWLDHAALHLAVIRWFGRFPQRNTPLGRETTPAEARFLDAIGGFP